MLINFYVTYPENKFICSRTYSLKTYNKTKANSIDRVASCWPGLNNPIGPIARNFPKWPSGNHICGPKLPAKLVFWKFGQQTFSCVNQLLNHCTPYTLLILRGVLQSDCHSVLNQVLFMIPTISSPLYLVWLYGQLIIEPWYESSMIQCK